MRSRRGIQERGEDLYLVSKPIAQLMIMATLKAMGCITWDAEADKKGDEVHTICAERFSLEKVSEKRRREKGKTHLLCTRRQLTWDNRPPTHFLLMLSSMLLYLLVGFCLLLSRRLHCHLCWQSAPLPLLIHFHHHLLDISKEEPSTQRHWAPTLH